MPKSQAQKERTAALAADRAALLARIQDVVNAPPSALPDFGAVRTAAWIKAHEACKHQLTLRRPRASLLRAAIKQIEAAVQAPIDELALDGARPVAGPDLFDTP